MARIANIDLPNKRAVIALTYIYGIGRTSAVKILQTADVSPDIRMNDLDDTQLGRVRTAIEAYTIEGELRSRVQRSIKRLMDIGCYRGLRHRRGLPVRGQRTKTNARTRKGRRSAVAKKRK